MSSSHPHAFLRRGLSIFATLVAVSVVARARPQHPNVTFGPAPDWVVTSPLGVARPYDEITQIDGLEHLLIDSQVRTGIGPRERYQHHVYRVLDEKGIRDASQLEIEFDPSYESVVIHGLAVYRGEQESSHVSESGIRVVEREQDLEAHIFDERLSIIAILSDVRIGDRIETAYTTRGENPVFEGRYAARFGLGWDAPVRRLSLRIVLPKERRLNVKLHRAFVDPAVIETAKTREFRWDLVDVRGVLLESQLPYWFEPYPFVDVSEYADWADVGRWGLRLYANPATNSPELQDKVDEIARLHADPDARIVAAWAFVRDEIRYLSMTLGPHSHGPSHPETVLQRRFGDCKDKAVLLVALLEGLDIDARPAFVSTEIGRHIADKLPSPLVFDHVIVEVKHGGRTHWIDPTPLHTRGSLECLSSPRYGRALVLDETTTAPVSIEPPASDHPRQEIRTNIDASGPGREARITVETTCSWGAADTMRAQLGEVARASLEKSFLDFYAQAHPSIRSDGPIEVRDDERRNVIVTTERYVVPDFWQLSDDGIQLAASIDAREISGIVSIPATTVRTMPLGISHPTHIDCHTTARLPRDWNLEPLQKKVETEAVRFSCDIRSSGPVVYLDYDYQTFQDSLAPEKALAHVEQLNRILELTQYSLWQPADGEGEALGGVNWTVLLFAAMSFVIAAAGSIALYFLYRPKPIPIVAEPGDAELQGIQSWLILLAIGVAVSPFSMLWDLRQLVPAFGLSTWVALTTPGHESYHALWAPVLLGELFINIVLVALSVLVAVVFFQRRRSFPKLFVATRVAGALVAIFDSVALRFLPDASGEGLDPGLVRLVLSTVVWSIYVLRSRRVRLTFVR